MEADILARARRVILVLRGTELRAAATPWELDRCGNILTTGQERDDVAIFGTPNFEPDGGDMAAIVALRNAAPALLALAEATGRHFEALDEMTRLTLHGEADDPEWDKWSARNREARDDMRAALAQLAALADGADDGSQ